MIQIKPEHILLGVEELINNYAHKTDSSKGGKRVASQAISALTGERTHRASIVDCANIYYLPQLLFVDIKYIEKSAGIGPLATNVIKAAIEDLGYNIGILSDHAQLGYLQQNVIDKSSQINRLLEERTGQIWHNRNNKSFQAALAELRDVARDGLEGIFILEKEYSPTLPTEQCLPSEFNLSATIQGALIQQLGLEQAPDPKTEMGQAFQNAVSHIMQSIEGQASLIKQALPSFDKKL